MSRSRGRRLKNYQPKDPYRGREYEDDPRAAPPGPLRRLALEMASGCGNSAALCAEAQVHARSGAFGYKVQPHSHQSNHGRVQRHRMA